MAAVKIDSQQQNEDDLELGHGKLPTAFRMNHQWELGQVINKVLQLAHKLRMFLGEQKNALQFDLGPHIPSVSLPETAPAFLIILPY